MFATHFHLWGRDAPHRFGNIELGPLRGSQFAGTREATGRMINGSCGTIAAVGASAWASICWPKSQCDTHTLMGEPDRLAISPQSVGIA